jgi:hypothetical protein
MIRSLLVTVPIAALIGGVACAPRIDNPDIQQVREALPACVCWALCGTQGEPFTTASPTNPPILEVDWPLANTWGTEVFSSGQCKMGQYSKRIDVLGTTVYEWVANPAVPCPPCICPFGPFTPPDAGCSTFDASDKS